MRQRVTPSLWILSCFAIIATLGPAVRASAQDKPRSGGELVFVVAAEPPGFDGHREETFAMLNPVGPHYNTLLRVDPFDRTGTKFIGDLASPWNWISKADILAKDPHWYEKNVMGTGPFTFGEYARGSHWIGRKARLLGQGQALSRRLPRDLHPGRRSPGGGDPRGTRDDPVPRLHPRPARHARDRARQQDQRPGKHLTGARDGLDF